MCISVVKQYIFTAGAKGGTEKSTAIRFLTTYLWKNGHDPLLLDMDEKNVMIIGVSIMGKAAKNATAARKRKTLGTNPICG